MSNEVPFKFKQFTVKQDQCAMKIGTDGVLLGAWASLKNNPFSLLDIGAGTGIIALMLAQRSTAEVIDALEIDTAAYEQCVANFENSPWADRLFCYHADLEEFANEIDDTYDVIVCNPPFYAEHYKADNPQRAVARFQDAMPFQHLLESVATLLAHNGNFYTIIPHQEEARFLNLAKAQGLHPYTICHVKGNLNAPVKRSLIGFSKTATPTHNTTLTIETERHKYTKDYIELTKDFYLKM